MIFEVPIILLLASMVNIAFLEVLILFKSLFGEINELEAGDIERLKLDAKEDTTGAEDLTIIL
jgi:hypothetical protein